MTKPPKTLEEIKQEWINEAFELEKAKAYKCCESCGNNFSNANTYFHYGFKAGFDCRDKLANEKLQKLIESWPVVYASKPDGKSELWSNNETTGHDTHRAFLAFIEEIKKDCKHEPFNDSCVPNHFHCKHCGVELQATWSEVKK